MNSLAHRLPALFRPALPALAMVLALTAAGSVAGQDENPFARPAPAGPTPPPAASPLDALELRGVFDVDGAMVVLLYDTASSRSSFVTVDGAAGDYAVSDLQTGDGSVLVRSGGKERRVTLKKAQIVTMVAPPPVPVPQPGVPQVAAVPPPPPGQPGAMGDEEVRARMQRVAEEIRRRREMRREIMERSQQGQPAPQQ